MQPRAHIVPTRPVIPYQSAGLAPLVHVWVADRVAAHKKLQGGVVPVDQIPKRYGVLLVLLALLGLGY
jgi:4-coumarate--CoA ligase